MLTCSLLGHIFLHCFKIILICFVGYNMVKRLYKNTPEGSRSVGRPRLRWMDAVREDLRRMGVTNWRIRAHRRDDWKMVVKVAKVLQGL